MNRCYSVLLSFAHGFWCVVVNGIIVAMEEFHPDALLIAQRIVFALSDKLVVDIPTVEFERIAVEHCSLVDATFNFS